MRSLNARLLRVIGAAWEFRLAQLTYCELAWAAARDAFDSLCREYPDGPWHIASEYTAADCSEQLGEWADARARFERLNAAHQGIAEARAACDDIEAGAPFDLVVSDIMVPRGSGPAKRINPRRLPPRHRP